MKAPASKTLVAEGPMLDPALTGSGAVVLQRGSDAAGQGAQITDFAPRFATFCDSCYRGRRCA